jgi:Uma2 family endonuclease
MFSSTDVMQPDLLIACDLEDTDSEKDRYLGTPTLIVEILSPGTRPKDMVDKLNTYMLSCAREYWVFDPKKKTILEYGFKDLKVDGFHDYKLPDKLRSYFFEGLEADLTEVFSP